MGGQEKIAEQIQIGQARLYWLRKTAIVLKIVKQLIDADEPRKRSRHNKNTQHQRKMKNYEFISGKTMIQKLK